MRLSAAFVKMRPQKTNFLRDYGKIGYSKRKDET